MEEQKNMERSDSALGEMSSSLQELSLRASSHLDDPEDEDLPDNLLQSFCTETDEDLLQKEYDMLSSGSLNELIEINEGTDGEIANGIYFDKLELELNAIEQAMSQFEGRLDSLREQAQDLLITLQTERMASAADLESENLKSLPEVSEVEIIEERVVINENGSGDD